MGTATEQMLTGPVDQTIDVSGTWSLATWVSSGFTVTMDGKEVDFTSDATTGMPTATVNFKDYLASWAKDHPDVKVDGLDSSSTSSGSTGSTSSTSNSTSSGHLVAVGYRHGFVRRFLDDIDGYRFDHDERYRV